MVEWSRAFGDVPILLHAADREWVMRAAPAYEYWEGGTREPWGGMPLVRCGGHFAGGTVAHVPHPNDVGCALLRADVNERQSTASGTEWSRHRLYASRQLHNIQTKPQC